MWWIERKSSRRLLLEFRHLNKERRGWHTWSQEFFAASPGIITNEAIWEYIRTQGVTKKNGHIKVDDERPGRASVGLGADCHTNRLQTDRWFGWLIAIDSKRNCTGTDSSRSGYMSGSVQKEFQSRFTPKVFVKMI